ncbi:hypothetical protein ACFQGE_11925 [Halomicroarcula sp. GCM10025817]|uniref:hypothetical protein n=1 Tax=Haloarcula TaxID=2237 RepID=UPI0023E7B52F|nr:hypothetical protein [Halomicroarcula sp. SYNS111]
MTGRESLTRRTVLGALASAGATSVAGCSALQGESDSEATEVEDDQARELAAQFAPRLYFDEHEPWFPTDPRPYTSEQDGESVVTGFDAFDGYHEQFTGEQPPNPTVFYNVVQYEESPLAAVQFWMYAAFDQFTTNFHWHDWEVLHVFIDTDSGAPQLYVASSHSRNVPNNEFLDPDPESVPRILSELGSHSSALSLNDIPDRFQRLPTGDSFADITNRPIETLEDIASIPLAYGLPRDEGRVLPYVMPELDGAPIYEDDRLPSVEQSDLVSQDLTIRSFDALSSPPTTLPERATGLVFDHEEREGDAEVGYSLVPTSEIEHITDFTGPQLSFEFAVPQFAEDAIAGHITTTGAPWGQPRYSNPAADISEPAHRAALAERYDAIGAPSSVNTVVANVTEAVVTDDAPDGEGLTTQSSHVEALVLLESEPEAAPTFGGVAALQGIPVGEHRLTVNGAGQAPHSETIAVEDGGGNAARPVTAAGVEGEIPLVARESATKLEVDSEGADSDLTDLAVEDDFAGRLYDAPLAGPDAVYVHRGGAYTTEVRDSDDEIGAFRVNPDPESDDGVRIDEPNTGKASLARFLADISDETRAGIAAVADSDGDDDSGSSGGEQGQTGGGRSNAVRGLAQALGAVAEAARRAAERAENGDRGRADESLGTVVDRLQRVAERLSEARGDLPNGLGNATERRLEQANRRSEQARSADKL